ncbi:MAG TPA: DUF2304 family protein [Candidatus Binatia bacterium]|nr:DUF2304 family protein [Candidatus Binatia bacterium]
MIPTALQISVTLFALFALSRAFLRMKGHQLTMSQTLFWVTIWMGVIVVVWIPWTAYAISKTLGIDARQPIDTLIYITIVALFYLIYRMHVKQEQVEQELTKLVRKIAMKK